MHKSCQFSLLAVIGNLASISYDSWILRITVSATIIGARISAACRRNSTSKLSFLMRTRNLAPNFLSI